MRGKSYKNLLDKHVVCVEKRIVNTPTSTSGAKISFSEITFNVTTR